MTKANLHRRHSGCHFNVGLNSSRYIVECSTDVQPPAYLRRNDVYDLSPVANPEHKSSIKPFKSLDPEAWPDMEELGLDVSQMKAFQLALTKELAIIQGPPGTGEQPKRFCLSHNPICHKETNIEQTFHICTNLKSSQKKLPKMLWFHPTNKNVTLLLAEIVLKIAVLDNVT